ncbi:phospholipase [Burkholderia multivorans]|nr:phospholipase [Burkholderia multivorans]
MGKIATLLFVSPLAFSETAMAQGVLPAINVTGSRPYGSVMDFAGDIGPPSKGPTSWALANVPNSPRLQCQYTQMLRRDLKNCDFSNPPNIGVFRLHGFIPRNQPFTSGISFVPNRGVLQNGCGPASGWMKYVIPNAPFGYDFTSACNNHDVCYGSKLNKALCDNLFERDMKQICNGSGLCGEIAEKYADAVRKFGDKPYQEAVDQWYCALFGFLRGVVSKYTGASLCNIE